MYETSTRVVPLTRVNDLSSRDPSPSLCKVSRNFPSWVYKTNSSPFSWNNKMKNSNDCQGIVKNKKPESREVQMVNPFTLISATDTYRFYSVWHNEINF